MKKLFLLLLFLIFPLQAHALQVSMGHQGYHVYAKERGVVCDGSTDDSAAVQAINDSLSSLPGPGVIELPGGTCKFNITIGNKISLIGQGINKTKVIPATDDAVIKTSLTENTTDIAVKNLWIYGDLTKASQDGIRLKVTAAGKWVDGITLDNVYISNSGRYGLYTYGTATTGPFVQRLRIYNSYFDSNKDSGLYTDGYLFEAVAVNSSFTRNGDATHPNVYAKLNGASGRVHRFLFLGCLFNISTYPTTGTAAKFEHAKGISFINSDFEEAAYMLYLTGNLTTNISVIGSNFTSTGNVTAGIYAADAIGLVIENNSFVSNGTMTNAIVDSGASTTSKVRGPRIGYNLYGSGVTTSVSLSDNLTISAGKAYAYKDFLRLDTEAAAATDDLDYIYDDSGTASTANLQHGQLITVRPLNAAHAVVVKHNVGNIMLKAGADTNLNATHLSVTLKWDAITSKWIEI